MYTSNPERTIKIIKQSLDNKPTKKIKWFHIKKKNPKTTE